MSCRKIRDSKKEGEERFGTSTSAKGKNGPPGIYNKGSTRKLRSSDAGAKSLAAPYLAAENAQIQHKEEFAGSGRSYFSEWLGGTTWG